MVAREPADTPTDQFVPHFTDPGLGARLRTSQVADGGDVGLSLFEVADDPLDDPVPSDAPRRVGDPAGRSGDRRTAVVACLVVLAALLGAVTGYAVVRSAGLNAVWVKAGSGAVVPPSPDTSLGPAQQAEVVPSGSASPSASPGSPAPSTPATPRDRPGSGGETPRPTTPGPEPTRESPSPSPSVTSPTRPEPTPSVSKPHDD